MRIKHFISIIVFTLMLTGCTNEPLPVVKNPKFVVNNVNLMDSFTFEFKEGEITKFPSGYIMLTSLFIYDKNGDLVQNQDIKTKYFGLVEFPLPAEPGKYTLVSVTQMCKSTSTDKNHVWKSFYPESLYTLLLTATSKNLSDSKGVLGLHISEVDTSAELPEDGLQVSIKPATSLIAYRVKDIHKFGDAGSYSLAINKSEYDAYIGNDSFEYYAEASDSPSKYIAEIMPSDYGTSIKNVYGYYTLLPTGKTAFRFDHCTSSTNKPLTSVFTITPKSGEEYLVELNLNDASQNNEITWSTSLVNGASKAGIDTDIIDAESEQSALAIDLWNRMND